MEIVLSEEEVKNIVTAHLKEKFKCVGEVKIDVGTSYRAINQINGYYVGKFKGIKAKVEV